MRIKTESNLTQSTARLRVALEIIDDLLQSTVDECYQPGGKKDRIRSRAKEFRDEARKGGVE